MVFDFLFIKNNMSDEIVVDMSTCKAFDGVLYTFVHMSGVHENVKLFIQPM